MVEATKGRSSRPLGMLCVLIGVASLGYGIMSHRRGNGLDAFDGILLGVVSLMAGFVILRRRT